MCKASAQMQSNQTNAEANVMQINDVEDIVKNTLKQTGRDLQESVTKCSMVIVYWVYEEDRAGIWYNEISENVPSRKAKSNIKVI